MAKLKNPLLSLGAVGRLAKVLTFARRRKTNIAEKNPIPKDAKSLAQLSWRHMYQKGVALWHALSAAEKLEWESLARPKHMTGFAWFMSQALKPNPGLYLPLQGGTMSGEIDMAKHRIRRLPVPEGVQDPLRVHEYNTAIAPFLLTEGARVYHNVAQAIPNTTPTALAFNSERYDTDTIHDPITNNSRLTCKTAGKYLITGSARFATNAAGIRFGYILLNGTVKLNYDWSPKNEDNYWIGLWATVYDLSVGNYVELIIYQSSGGALNIDSEAQHTPEFMMQRIG